MNIFKVSRIITVKSGKRLSIYQPQLVNKVNRYSHNLGFKDFKQYIILFNISDLFLEFDLNFLHINNFRINRRIFRINFFFKFYKNPNIRF